MRSDLSSPTRSSPPPHLCFPPPRQGKHKRSPRFRGRGSLRLRRTTQPTGPLSNSPPREERTQTPPQHSPPTSAFPPTGGKHKRSPRFRGRGSPSAPHHSSNRAPSLTLPREGRGPRRHPERSHATSAFPPWGENTNEVPVSGEGGLFASQITPIFSTRFSPSGLHGSSLIGSHTRKTRALTRVG